MDRGRRAGAPDGTATPTPPARPVRPAGTRRVHMREPQRGGRGRQPARHCQRFADLRHTHPGAAATVLLRQLGATGARLRYQGDFAGPGSPSLTASWPGSAGSPGASGRQRLPVGGREDGPPLRGRPGSGGRRTGAAPIPDGGHRLPRFRCALPWEKVSPARTGFR